MYTHTFSERGGGFPRVEDDVIQVSNGEMSLLTVVSVSPIRTAQWQANMVYLECEECDTDWDDLSDRKQERLYDRLYHVFPIGDYGRNGLNGDGPP